jgi:hypothetical protein
LHWAGKQLADLHGVGRRHSHRLKDVHSVDGGDLDGGPVIDAEVEVEGGGRVEAVVVAVVEGGPDEVPAARRDRPERVAAARGAGAGEVADVAVPVGQSLVDVRRAHDGVEPLPGVDEAGVGDVGEAPRGGVRVAPVLGDAAVDADEARCMHVLKLGLRRQNHEAATDRRVEDDGNGSVNE